MTANRERLPNRRDAVSFGFQHRGVDYVATVTFFDNGRLAEIFIDGRKPGSQIAEFANDAAVLVSLLLQHSVTAAAIKHAAEQKARYEADAGEENIGEYLKEKAKVLVGQIAREALHIETRRIGTADQRRIAAVLEQLDWKRLPKDGEGKRWWTKA